MSISKPKILLAVPTFDYKEYAIQEWLDRAETYTYPHETLLVDNSAGPGFYERWGKKTEHLVRLGLEGRGVGTPVAVDWPIDQGPPPGSYRRPLALAAELIRQYALARAFDYWLNLDVDEFSTPDLIDYLLELCGDADVLNHASPNQQGDLWIERGFGCVLFNRRVLSAIDFSECPDDLSHDVWFYRKLSELNASGAPTDQFVVKSTRGSRILEHWEGQYNVRVINTLKVKLDDPFDVGGLAE